MIGFKEFLLLLSLVFSVHTFKWGLDKTWITHSYLRKLYAKDIKNSKHYNTYTTDECCKLVKYDCNNDIIIKQTILPKNKNLYFVNSLFQKKYIANDSINSNIEINTFMEPTEIIMWAS